MGKKLLVYLLTVALVLTSADFTVLAVDANEPTAEAETQETDAGETEEPAAETIEKVGSIPENGETEKAEEISEGGGDRLS